MCIFPVLYRVLHAHNGVGTAADSAFSADRCDRQVHQSVQRLADVTRAIRQSIAFPYVGSEQFRELGYDFGL